MVPDPSDRGPSMREAVSEAVLLLRLGRSVACCSGYRLHSMSKVAPGLPSLFRKTPVDSRCFSSSHIALCMSGLGIDGLAVSFLGGD